MPKDLGPKTWRGQCACGALRYAASAIHDIGFCHCRRCQQRSGTDAVCWLRAPTKRVVFTGEPSIYPDGAHGARWFCRTCGTAPLEQDEAVTYIAAGTLDEPDAIAPTYHQHVRFQRTWARYWDGLYRYVDEAPLESSDRGWRPPRARSCGAAPHLQRNAGLGAPRDVCVVHRRSWVAQSLL
ncbi:MAG: GFA family protein [Myxococcota bacterium]